jgi:DNA polymerase-3 subunit gamma/tau
MMVHIRALLIVKIAGFDSELVQLPETEADELKRLGEYFSEQDLLRFFQILTKAEEDIRNSSQPRFQLEIGLVRMAQARRLFLLEEALSRIEAIEAKLIGGGATPSPARGSSSERPQRAPESLRSSTPARSPSPSSRTGGGKPPREKPQPKGQSSISSTEAANASAFPTAAVGASAAKSSGALLADEPPPMDELYEAPPDPFEERPVRTAVPGGASPVDRIKAALEDKRKMIIVSALDKGTISIDSDHLNVEYSEENVSYKAQLETRDNRKAIEDTCEQVFGQRLTLKCSMSGQTVEATATGGNGQQRKPTAKTTANDDPRLKALIDKFHGEVVDVIKPDQ